METFRLSTAKNSRQRIALTCIRVLVGLILLKAGIAKVTDFESFVAQVAMYDLLPMALVRWASYVLIAAEVTVGVTLALGYLSRGASGVGAVLFGLFIAALVNVMHQGILLEECGCGNFLFELFHWDVGLSWQVVLVDVVLLGGCLYIAIARMSGYGLDSVMHRGKAHALDTDR